MLEDLYCVKYNVIKQLHFSHRLFYGNQKADKLQMSTQLGWVMNLRTPRRRLSPRTKRRYCAFKNFLRRTLGASSQVDKKKNSSLSVSATNLEQKIVDIEQQLNKVSKDCKDLTSLKYGKGASTLSTVPTDMLSNADSIKETEAFPLRKVETKVLYKTPPDQYCKSSNCKSLSKLNLCNDEDVANLTSQSKMTNQIYTYKKKGISKHHYSFYPIQECEKTLRNRKNHSTLQTYKDVYPLKSFHSLIEPKATYHHREPGCTGIHRHKKGYEREYLDTNHNFTKENDVELIEQRCGDQKHRHYKNKYKYPELKQDFIEDIIKRQYRPIKLFGRKESDFSQFSAPVCRDQEVSYRETMLEGSELCSCCHGGHKRKAHSKYKCNNDYSDIRSLCDTRLYSCKTHKHQLKRKKRFKDYNDSTLYDIIPVKEKSSPKSRRKFVEDNILMHAKYKEVPPSPRTQRPRLNLQAQFHTEDDDEKLNLEERLRHNRQYKSRLQNDEDCSNISSNIYVHNRNGKQTQKSQFCNHLKPYNSERVDIQRYKEFLVPTNEQATKNNVITLNNQTTDMSVDKTDKTLGEIKDILQNFLLEIKKESSQTDKINSTSRPGIQNLNQFKQTSNNKNAAFSHSRSFNNNNAFGHCRPTYMQPFPNPCCYPIIPVCPMNCMQNEFVVQRPSFTCATCTNDWQERTCGISNSPNKVNSETTTSETQKLIKEIHKLISQNPNTAENKESWKANSPTTRKYQIKYCEAQTLKSRSVGSSGLSNAPKHDAKIGTPTMKCYSKSCEAIGSRIGTNTQTNVANVNYSDTVLEKGSSEDTNTTEFTSESDYSSETATVDKKNTNKFTNMLRSIGLLKKNKNEVIEELSESDSNIEVAKPKSRSPFQQHIINYNVHDQKYFQPPPKTPYPFHQIHQHNEYFNQASYQNHQPSYLSTHVRNKTKDYNGRTSYNQSLQSHCPSPCHGHVTPCANYYDPRFNNISPQVPLCLKEIEVKSIGTQSVKKISLLDKITNKMQVSDQLKKQPSQKQSSTKPPKAKNGSNLFDWKKLQETVMQNNTDPIKFSYKTQKRLAQSDIKMRNAMLKKLFYKRNPFSPRNLLVRTLLGKDKSSFGEPPKMYKPRMFL